MPSHRSACCPPRLCQQQQQQQAAAGRPGRQPSTTAGSTILRSPCAGCHSARSHALLLGASGCRCWGGAAATAAPSTATCTSGAPCTPAWPQQRGGTGSSSLLAAGAVHWDLGAAECAGAPRCPPALMLGRGNPFEEPMRATGCRPTRPWASAAVMAASRCCRQRARPSLVVLP